MSSDFTMYAGDTKNVEITVTDEEGLVIDLTDCELFWELSRIVGVQPPLLDKEIGSGLTVVTAAAGRFDVRLEPEDTESLEGVYYHEAKLVDDQGDVSTILSGWITISPTQVQIP